MLSSAELGTTINSTTQKVIYYIKGAKGIANFIAIYLNFPKSALKIEMKVRNIVKISQYIN
jgi:hypothetical protein